MKIGVFLKDELSESDIATSIISKISEYGFDFDLDNPDVVIFVGGDGTFLRAVKTYINKISDITFIGINEGSLGFYPNYGVEDLDDILIALKNDRYVKYSFSLLEGIIGTKTIFAVNEIRIENPFHVFNADVYVNGDYLESYRGNGLCVSSSNGSSAYNKSLGGAVVLPSIETLQLTEIAPINNRVYSSLASPLVLDEESFIRFNGNLSDSVIGYDHLTMRSDSDEITIYLSSKKINLVYKEDHSFIKQIREAFIR